MELTDKQNETTLLYNYVYYWAREVKNNVQCNYKYLEMIYTFPFSENGESEC